MDTKRDILGRVYLSFIGIVLMGSLVLGRAVYIQRVEGNYWRALSDSMRQRFVPLDAQRGTIYTEKGEMLSASVPTFDLYFDFQADGLREGNGKVFFAKIDSFARSMSAYFGDRSAAEYASDFKAGYKKGDRYYPLKKKLSFEQYKAFRSFPLANLGRNKSGLIVEVHNKRLVPYGLLASRTIGLSREYILSDGKIKKMNVGLEQSYDSLLSGRDGQRMVRFIAPGTAIPIDGTELEPINGKDIYTTLDLSIQDITEQALLQQLEKFEALYGTAIVIETATGKIKAIANLGRRSDGSYWEDDNYALRYTEPGSTIKLVTLMAVLEKGTSRATDSVFIGTAQTAQVGPKSVTDAERSIHPVLTVPECFAHSSNIGMSRLALKAFGERPGELREYMHRFRMDEPLQVGLSTSGKPTFVDLEKKGSGLSDMLSMSFGYASTVSPLNTLTLYNAVANGGKMMKPYLVHSIRQGGVLYRQFEPTVLLSAVARPEVIQAARKAMELVTTEGTAKYVFKGMPFSVAGKTGTNKIWDGPYTYDDGVYQASFVGFFPADQPKYSCIVLIRTKPHAANIFGGTLAAPVFREIATKLYAMYVDRPEPHGVVARADSSLSLYAGYRASLQRVYSRLGLSFVDSTQRGDLIQVRAQNAQNVWRPQQVPANTLPDLRGMSLRDAIGQVDRMRLGIQVEVIGKGKIIKQSIPAGTTPTRGSKLTLELGGS